MQWNEYDLLVSKDHENTTHFFYYYCCTLNACSPCLMMLADWNRDSWANSLWAYCCQGLNGYWKVEKIRIMSYSSNSGKNDSRGR